MTYVIADIHGEFEKFTKMLERIAFSENDILYILGDAIDRGREPLRVIMNMMARRNVRPIMGNHELMALRALEPFFEDSGEDGFDAETDFFQSRYLEFWRWNGGNVTFESFKSLPSHIRRDIWRYMKRFAPYAEYENEKGEKFILVHGGLGGYRPDKALCDYSLRELTSERPSIGREYYGKDVTVIVGHTPTLTITGKPRIFTSCNTKFIDCGATFGGALACLCLDTMEEFYI